MKKFYTLALAAAVALGASAAEVAKKAQTYQIVSMEEAVELMAKPAPRKSAPQKSQPTNIAELQGLYDAAYATTTQNGWAAETSMMGLLPGVNANTVDIVGLTETTVEASVNYPAGTITIPDNIPLGTFNFQGGMEYAVALIHMVPLNDGSNGLTEANTPYVLNIYDDGTIEADPDDYFMAKIVTEGADYGKSVIGMSKCQIVLTKQATSTDTWSDVTECDFIDSGYAMPFFLLRNMDKNPTLTCTVQRNNQKPNLYRLNNPYAEINQVLTRIYGKDVIANAYDLPGYITLDMTDPDCILVPYDYVGVIDSELGIIQATNNAANLVDQGATVDDIKAQFAKDQLAYYNTDENTIYINDALVSCNLVTKVANSTIWIPEAAVGIEDTFTIFLKDSLNSGINDVIADNENAPVEYFNLQGVRVENPSNGLYIKRQGNKVTKVAIR